MCAEPLTPVVSRRAARVLLVEPGGRTLLFRGGDPGRPAAGTWWFTPGGGLDPGESVAAAARREVREETGAVVDELGPVIHRRRTRFEFEGTTYDQLEEYFLVHVPDARVDVSGWNEIERRAMREHRWWSPAELRDTDETIHPAELADLLDRRPDPGPRP